MGQVQVMTPPRSLVLQQEGHGLVLYKREAV